MTDIIDKNGFNVTKAQKGGKVECWNSLTNEWDALEFDENTRLYSHGVFTAMDREERLGKKCVFRNVS